MKTAALFLAIMLLFAGCDRPNCKNSNPIFEEYAPETEIYKTELANSLMGANKSKLRFWFDDIKEFNGRKLLLFNVQNDKLCAIMAMEFEPMEKLQFIIEKNGKSFHGAEFKNLKFQIQNDSSTTRFILKDFDEIID